MAGERVNFEGFDFVVDLLDRRSELKSVAEVQKLAAVYFAARRHHLIVWSVEVEDGDSYFASIRGRQDRLHFVFLRP